VYEASVLNSEAHWIGDEHMEFRDRFREAAIHVLEERGCKNPKILDFYMPEGRALATVRVKCS